MKNQKHELLGRLQRQYHQQHPWNLTRGGLYVPYSYKDVKPIDLSWSDEVGFILNRRRVIVGWQHPRDVYRCAIYKQSLEDVGHGPDEDWCFDGAIKNYKRVGATRKKVISYTSREPSPKQHLYYELLRSRRQQLCREGIDRVVHPTWKSERLNWALAVTLIAPLEVRNELELSELALFTRQLLLGQTTLEKLFPEYRYDRVDWIREQGLAR